MLQKVMYKVLLNIPAISWLFLSLFSPQGASKPGNWHGSSYGYVVPFPADQTDEINDLDDRGVSYPIVWQVLQQTIVFLGSFLRRLKESVW